jgi:hypothetical protein
VDRLGGGILIAAFGGTVGLGLAAVASSAALALYSRLRVSADRNTRRAPAKAVARLDLTQPARGQPR